MKTIASLISLFFCMNLTAQTFNSAGDYMSYISKQDDNITTKFLAYNSAASHGKRARKVEKLRQSLMKEVEESRMNIASMGKWNNDGAYRDSAVNFMKFYFNILNDDYARIVNMEEIAEQSYDEMEAFLNVQEQIDVKMKEANERFSAAQKDFAMKNNINLIDGKSERSEMMKKVSSVNKRYHEIFLISFKPRLQEENLLEALRKDNITAIEQDRNALAQYAQEALVKLDALAPGVGDGGMRNALKQLLQFYLKEANEKISDQTAYVLAKEKFETLKKDFDKKSNHTKEEVDAYNEAVKAMNNSANKANATNNFLNENRTNLFNNWNEAIQSYFDDQMPVYKRR